MSAIDIRFACPDWWDRLQRGETPISDQVLDEEMAEIAVALFDKLRVPDIPGQPRMADAAGEWVRDIVRVAFGSIDREAGRRVVGEIFNLVPKKNAKTTNAAALGLVAMQMNTVPNIDGVIIGPTQEVADKCFAQAQAMIEADDWLKKRFRVQEHRKTIIDLHRDPKTGRPLNAKLKVKSFDPAVVTGGIPAFAILDEIHVMAAKSYASRVLRQIRGGMITNPLSLLLMITTQSEEPPVGIFKDELEYARKVRDGVVSSNVRLMPVMYEFPEPFQKDKGEPWKDPRNWSLVLPNLGRSITIDRLIPDFEKAKETSAEELAGWASQHLNIQIGMGHHLSQWVGAGHWNGGTDTTLTLAELMARAEVCTIGIDGGGLDDLLGLSVLGRERSTKRWLSWSRAWAYETVLQRQKQIVEALRTFETAGDLVICSYPGQGIEELVAICVQLRDAGLIPEAGGIGLDNASGVGVIIDALELAGIETDTLKSVSQGYLLTGTIKSVEFKLFDGTFLHADQPLMTWCVGNAKTEPKGNAVVVTKAVSGAAKIDPLMALFNAAQLMSLNPEAARGPSVYERRGMLTV
ncbi:phage terminase large subunit-like protein [Palleronia aestuarii]|uniref:Phage terminase large subunit-like protein n=1 Tax=Palleronia aestuarii TaxID=568105 RepID=A0A2W7QD78_9RHOB|nr:terminase large subunit [Palleronia aestuarii]PZX19809.1 phage terminase large subunit-like protein [Palleronia aestuarii]